jgi:hypothetical protein
MCFELEDWDGKKAICRSARISSNTMPNLKIVRNCSVTGQLMFRYILVHMVWGYYTRLYKKIKKVTDSGKENAL